MRQRVQEKTGGTVNTKAIRQAVDAKLQVADPFESTKLKKVAIAIGRRISAQAINEEKKWSKNADPVLLLDDVILHYLILKSSSINFSTDSLVEFFTKNHGIVTNKMIVELFSSNTGEKKLLKQIEKELIQIERHIASDDIGS